MLGMLVKNLKVQRLVASLYHRVCFLVHLLATRELMVLAAADVASKTYLVMVRSVSAPTTQVLIWFQTCAGNNVLIYRTMLLRLGSNNSPG
jgi:hypothetical protein